MATKPAPVKAAAAPVKAAAPSVASQLAAVNTQIQATSLGIAQSLATQNQTAQAAAAKSAADAAAAQQQAAAYQVQLAQAQSQAAQLQGQANTNQAAQNISNQNALQLMQSTLAGYGIDPTGAISNAILGLTQKNYDATTISALAQDPNANKSSDPNVVALANAWQTRFAGNTARTAAGLTPLDPATYIATENSYKAVMQRAGIPASSPLMDTSYFAKLLGTDLSPLEVQQRVDAATAAVTATDPYTTQQLQQNFGLTQSDMISHLLDPTTAATVIQQKVQASQISGEAGRQNLALNQQNAQSLAAQGVTQAQAQSGFTNVATQLGQEQQLASIYGMNAANVGTELTAQQFNANLNGTSAAQANIELARLRAQEVNQFSGSSGAAKGSLYTEQSGVS